MYTFDQLQWHFRFVLHKKASQGSQSLNDSIPISVRNLKKKKKKKMKIYHIQHDYSGAFETIQAAQWRELLNKSQRYQI